MSATLELPTSFIHQAPKGYEYRALQFKRNVISIWTVYSAGFDYNHRNPVHCIWGFYDSKKGVYYAPINSKTIGSVVDIKNTTAYSAMQLNLNPLAYALYS